MNLGDFTVEPTDDGQIRLICNLCRRQPTSHSWGWSLLTLVLAAEAHVRDRHPDQEWKP